MGSSPRVAEITLSAAWHAGAVPARLATTDGVSLEIVHRGTWSHGLGPDFRDALILFDGRELRAGSVEIHLRTRGWSDHGHHLDPAYDTVVLHLVGQHDGTETRRLDGAIVPVAVIGPVDRFAVPEFAAWDWQSVGGATCAPRLSVSSPTSAREVLHHLGDVRLAARSARLEGRLSAESPGEILWAELLDGLGFAMNREPMRRIARVVPLTAIEALLHALPAGSREAVARGVLLGVAGFLPLSPSEAHLGGLTDRDVSELESQWLDHGGPWRDETIPATAWIRARVRPANHPVPRLLAAASLLASASAQGGTLATILGIVLEPRRPDRITASIDRKRGSPRHRQRPGDRHAGERHHPAGACVSRALRRSRPRRRRVQSVGAPPGPKPQHGDAARAATSCRQVTSGQNRCPRGAGSDPARHSALSAASLLRVSDRCRRALCQRCQRLRFPHS